jgi:hypothetical protein
VAAVVDGERLDDLGKRLLFVHGRILMCWDAHQEHQKISSRRLPDGGIVL